MHMLAKLEIRISKSEILESRNTGQLSSFEIRALDFPILRLKLDLAVI